MRAWMRPLIAAVAFLALVANGAPVAAQPTSASYESPTYGFEVSWDAEVWTPDDRAALVAAGPEAVDQIRLMHTAGATLHVVAGRYGYADAEACVAAESDFLASESGVTEYGPVILDDGQEMIGSEDGIAFGGFGLRFTPETGEPIEMTNFIECRMLPDSDAALLFILITTPESFEQHMVAAGAVNASLQLAQPDDAVAVASPVAETPVVEMPVAETPAIDDAWFDEQVATATASDSLFGPSNGQLVQTPGQTALADTGVDAANFFLRARIQVPTDPADTAWDFGVAFREQSSGDHYRLVFDASSGWYLSLGVESDVQTGTVAALATEPGAVNTLELVVAGETGAFRLNGELVGPLDLSALTDPGMISLGTAFFAVNTTADQPVTYRDLQLWPLAVVAPEGATPEPAIATGTAEPETPVATEEPQPVPTATPEVTATEESSPAATAAPEATAATPAEQVVVRLSPVDETGVEGLAVLYPVEGSTTVALRMLGATGDQIGAIHSGTCAAYEPLPAYALAGFDEAGRSSSPISLSFDEVGSEPLAIVLHASAAEFGTVMACGEINR